MNRSLVRFECEKSPLHTIVYGGTGTGKTFFLRQYLKLYSIQTQDLRTDKVRGKPSSLGNHEQSLFTDQNQNRDQNQNQVHNQNQNQDQAKNIVKVCKDDKDWIDPESNKFYTGFNKCDINMIRKNNMHKFQNCVIVLDDMGDMGDKLNKDIVYYFTEGRHYNIQMILMCHKPAQIINTARMSCDTFFNNL